MDGWMDGWMCSVYHAYGGFSGSALVLAENLAKSHFWGRHTCLNPGLGKTQECRFDCHEVSYL